MIKKSLAVSILGALALGPLGTRADKVPRVHALTSARIIVSPGEIITSGTVVMRDGIIAAVGPELEPPPDARVRELEGLTVYPGLIDPYTVRPWPQTESDKNALRQAGHESGLVTPERDMTYFAFDKAAAENLRETGFTTAVVAPKQGLFRGRSVVVNLGDGRANDNLVKRHVAQNVTVSNNELGGDYPTSPMGAIALLRQTLLDADWYRRAWDSYERNPSQERPPVDTALDTLGGVVSGEELLVVETDSPSESLLLSDLLGEQQISALLVGNGYEYRWLDEIAATGFPHLLPVDFPDPPEVEDDKDDRTVELGELRHWDLAPENPHRLLGTSLPVAFTTYGLDEPGQIHPQLARARERGLTADQALAALTTTPAELLGLLDRTGTIEAGKMANLVVVDGELFVEDPKIREVWIDGVVFEVEDTKPVEFEPAGQWTLTITSEKDEEIVLVVEIEGQVPSLSGNVRAGPTVIALSSVEASGSNLEVEFEGVELGFSGPISLTLEIEGDNAHGSGSGPQESFTVEGSRTPNRSEPEVPS